MTALVEMSDALEGERIDLESVFHFPASFMTFSGPTATMLSVSFLCHTSLFCSCISFLPLLGTTLSDNLLIPAHRAVAFARTPAATATATVT